jgi:serine/threonine protein phosphatase PrpC
MIYGGSSIKGKSHKQTGLPNQDAFAVSRIKGAFVMAVSDGLGSRDKSEIGSHAAVESVIMASRMVKADTDAHDIIRLVHAIWRTKLKGFTARDCACTCLFCILFDGGRIFAAALGDGMIAIKNGENQYILELRDKDFANSTNALDYCKLTDWRSIDEQVLGEIKVMLATDGVSDDIEEGCIFSFTDSLLEKIDGSDRTQRERNNYIVKLLHRWTRPFSNDDKTLLICKGNLK